MSSILKALRKLEEEKARRQQGSPDIARDILCGNFQRRRSAGWMIFCGAFLVVMVVGVLAFWLATSGVQERVPTVPSVGADPAPPLVRAQPSGEAQAPSLPQEPAPGKKKEEIPGASIEHADAKVQTVSMPTARPARVAPSPVPADPGPAPLSAPPSANDPPESLSPRFTLSGVAYQSDPDARMAIINELPVMKGTVIEGARVEEILRDRVYLSFRDRRLEVRLDPNFPGE